MKKIIIAIFLFFSLEISAQLNGEVGYSLSYMKADNINAIIDTYNKTGDNKLKAMNTLHLLDGFNIGASYRSGMWKMGVYWENLSANRTGIEGNIDNNDAFERKVYFYLNSLSSVMELQYEHLGLGATVDYNYYSLKTSINGTTSKIPLYEENFYSSKIYLIFYLRGSDKLGIAFKPYVRLPWSDSNISALGDFLKTGTGLESTEKFIQFGLTFTILNGPQIDL